MPDWISVLGVAMGSAWVSGINLYAAVVTLGLLERFGFAHLPGDLGFLASWWVIGLAGALFVIQFAAGKIPAVDSAWDAVHTFIRVPAGAILAAAAFAHFDPSIRFAALLLGGSIALGTHGSKAATRLGANLSPEPFSNISMSLLGDAAVPASLWMSWTHPLAFLVALVAALVVMVGVTWMLAKYLRRLSARVGNWFAVGRLSG